MNMRIFEEASTLGSNPHYFVYTPEALLSLFSIDYKHGDDIVLHIGTHKVDNGIRFVVNERIGGSWGRETTVGTVPADSAPLLRVERHLRGALIALDNRAPVIFATTTTLPIEITLRHSRSIRSTECGFSPFLAGPNADTATQLPSRKQLAALDPTDAAGFIDFNRHLADSGLLIVGGWLKNATQADLGNRRLLVYLGFAEGDLLAMPNLCWHQRPDLGDNGVGFLATVEIRQSTPVQLGQLLGVQVLADGASGPMIYAGAQPQAAEDQVVQWARDIAANASAGDVANVNQSLSTIYSGHDTLAGLDIHIGVDAVIGTRDKQVIVIGWMIGATDKITSIMVKGKQGGTRNLFPKMIATDRPDITKAFADRYPTTQDKHGFLLAGAGVESDGSAYLEIRLKSGVVGFQKLPRASGGGVTAIRRVLGAFKPTFDTIEENFSALAPSLISLNKERLAVSNKCREFAFGEIRNTPRCSLVIPLYGRIDFMMYQLALFEKDAVIQDEIIYVLDQPERSEEMISLARSSYERFGIPFRLLLSEYNRGFGPASNLGLHNSRGEFVCFMNSDIFPKVHNWLDFLVGTLTVRPDIGIIGPQLRFADDSIQHNGMELEAVPSFGNWMFPIHPGKGMRPIKREDACHIEPAISGACMLLRRSLALEVGGFDEEYIIGDFEDIDLCEKVKKRGLATAIDDRSVLYHLERQSQGNQADQGRINLTLLNAWIYQSRWCGNRSHR